MQFLWKKCFTLIQITLNIAIKAKGKFFISVQILKYLPTHEIFHLNLLAT